MSIFTRTRETEAAPKRSGMVLPDGLARFVPTDYSSINPASGLTAMQSVAIWSAADLAASLVSELPAEVFSGKVKRPSVPSNIDDPGDDGMGREDWAYRLMMSWLMRGNAYGAENSWDMRLRPMSIDILYPQDVTASIVDNEAQWYFRGRRLEGDNLREFRHMRVNPQPGTLLGQSVIEAHATSIGVSLRSAAFGDQWFREGAAPAGMLVNKAPLTEVDAATAKVKLSAATKGTREPLVLGEGWEYKTLQVSPNESQFLETQKYSESQCARLFGPGFAEILGYDTGDSMTYANIVDRRQDLLVLSLNKWIRRVERILTSLLPPSTQVVKLNREALLESTTLQRYQAHNLALTGGWMLPSEVRYIEDLPPIAGIDDRKPNTSQQGVTSGNAAKS